MRLPRRVVAFCRRPMVKYVWATYVRPVVVVAVVFTSFRSVVADWYDVPTGSMNPTIVEGDRIAINKLAYDLKLPYTDVRLAAWGSPGRGDVIVFTSPYDGVRLVKRVVAVAGDTVELDANALKVNGVAATYARGPGGTLVEVGPFTPAHEIKLGPAPSPRSTFGPVTVPSGCVFAMGDNRDNSFDSRFFGPVSVDRVTGRAYATALSFEPGRWLAPRWGRFFSGLR